MSRIRWILFGITMILVAGSSEQLADGGRANRLEGSWLVTSVQRDGEPDPLQMGARMTFAGNRIMFQPKALQIADGSS